jgi:hypothetical protein
MKKIRQCLTGLSLVLVFAALGVKANYNIYRLVESGGTGAGSFQLIGIASSPFGGNVAVTSDGSAVLLDNRTFWPTDPTTITNPPPSGNGMCWPWPCRLAE